MLLEGMQGGGSEPLVVILPMHGGWYDEMGVTSDIRAQFYDQARSLCDEAGVAYADFSSCEYENISCVIRCIRAGLAGCASSMLCMIS